MKVVKIQEVLEKARQHDFGPLKEWLAKTPFDKRKRDVNNTLAKDDKRQWTALHFVAEAEAKGVDIQGLPEALLIAGADTHVCDKKMGDTPFNIAAPASPYTGRLMTLHWLEQALADKKHAKGLNGRSGSHNSTLAQYMAKWLNDDEIEKQFKRGLEQQPPLMLAEPNASGWTPLHAACAMGRVSAVKVLAPLYTQKQRGLLTTEEYSADYGVTFDADATAKEIARMRLVRDKNLKPELRANLEECMAIIDQCNFKGVSERHTVMTR